jgi:ribosomal protein S18 acetylase RimI-like enzyme
MAEPRVEQLDAADYRLVKPLLVQLYLSEQPHFADHPQLSAGEMAGAIEDVDGAFAGENVILAVRDGDALAGFCWCVFFDPGTGLEGEIAELFVAAEHRGLGIARALLDRAVGLFRQRGVTLGYVWTRADNEAAVSLYRSAGFDDNPQLVLTWYPHRRRSSGQLESDA